MKPQDIFGVVVRGVGLVVAVCGVFYLLEGLNIAFATVGAGAVVRELFLNVILAGGGITIIGLALLRWADIVVGFAYGKSIGIRAMGAGAANPVAANAAQPPVA